VENSQNNRNESSKVISLADTRKVKHEREIYNRWVEFYKDQPHEDLLGALVYEHEHAFPLRTSPDALDQLRHKAMVDVLDDRAQTQFLKNVLSHIRASDT